MAEIKEQCRTCATFRGHASAIGTGTPALLFERAELVLLTEMLVGDVGSGRPYRNCDGAPPARRGVAAGWDV